MNSSSNIERSIIAAILREPGMFAVAQSRGVTVESFTVPICRTVWNTAAKITAAGGKPDLVSVGSQMPDSIDAVAELTGAISTTVNFDQWIASAKRYEAARAIESALPKIAEMAAGTEPDVKAIVGALIEAERIADEISTATRTPTLAEIAAELKHRISSGAGEEIPLFPKGTEGRLKVHIHKGEFTTIGADTGTGKTAFACGCVNTMLDEGRRVLYVCTESDSADIFARIIAARTKIKHYVYQNRAVSAETLETFGKCADEMSGRFEKQLFIVGKETGVVTPELIEGKIREIENSAGKIDVVFVDFIQDMGVERSQSRLNAFERIRYCVDALQTVLIKYHVAGIILSQINREGLKRGEKPTKHYLKDSSELEHKSHTVAFLYRDQSNQTVFYVDKTRNQDPFGILLGWNGTGYTSAQVAPDPPGRAKITL